ncbi:MAG TPA: LysR family transcriptional regulator [Xanthobacteraceae bacterium]|nr:LysR family transcriptional regulator [Xanthobacteraceae bacterium]
MPRARLNLEHLDTLLALLESGSFARAGARLGLAQSSVSQHLKRLEDTLGVPLIRRDRRGCRPTAAAMRLLPSVKGLLRLEERVVGAARQWSLRLGACSNIGIYLLPDLLRDFRERGGRQPELVIASNPEVVSRLERAEVDAALLEWWEPREGFRCAPWRAEPLVVIVAPGHPLSGRSTVSRSELAAMPLIGGEEGTGTGRLLRAYFAGAGMPRLSMQLGSTEAVKRAVEAGLGASLVLSCAVVNEIREGRLCALALADRPLQKALRLVWRDDLPNDEPLLAHLAAAGRRTGMLAFRNNGRTAPLR